MAQRLLGAAFLATGATAWITTAQQLYGGQIEEWQLETRNDTGLGDPTSLAAQYLSRGRLWSMPEDSMSTHGLGGGITWAWDPSLCSKLLPLFSECVFNLITCEDIKAALTRGFDSWARNSRYINFHDVTGDCEALGQLTPECPLAEVWIGPLECPYAPSMCNDTAGESRTTSIAASAMPLFVLTEDFRFTNGQRNLYKYRQRPTFEIVGGTLLFDVGVHTPGMCWYLDSGFCSGFHAMKAGFWGASDAERASNAFWLLSFLVWGLWFAWHVFVVYHGFYILFPREGTRDKLAKELREAAVSMSWKEWADLEDVRKKYALAVLKRFSAYRTIWIALSSILSIGVPCLYFQIVMPCWNCYDFEGAVVHEVGHLLGLGHPGLAIAPPMYASGVTFSAGHDTFNEILASGNNLDAHSCNYVWDSVRNGIPPEAELSQNTGLRFSVMESFTQNNPQQCLFEDDVEAIHTLYPDCTGASFGTVNCAKVSLNIGITRILIFLAIPLLIIQAIVFLIDHYVDQQRIQELKRYKKIQVGIDGKGAADESESSAGKPQKPHGYGSRRVIPEKAIPSPAPAVGHVAGIGRSSLDCLLRTSSSPLAMRPSSSTVGAAEESPWVPSPARVKPSSNPLSRCSSPSSHSHAQSLPGAFGTTAHSNVGTLGNGAGSPPRRSCNAGQLNFAGAALANIRPDADTLNSANAEESGGLGRLPPLPSRLPMPPLDAL